MPYAIHAMHNASGYVIYILLMLYAIHAIHAMHNAACLYLWFECMALALSRTSFLISTLLLL